MGICTLDIRAMKGFASSRQCATGPKEQGAKPVCRVAAARAEIGSRSKAKQSSSHPEYNPNELFTIQEVQLLPR